jgi:coenzyme F420-reducing hydrogenase alpha subunit
MLQAPDLLGHESALSLAAVAPDVVKTALRLKKIGNQLLRNIGGRSVHPVSAMVGGFYRWPKAEKLKEMLLDLRWGLDASIETAHWAVTLPFPEMDVDYEFVALTLPDEYAIIEGDVLSSKNGIVPVEKFNDIYPEKHVRHSNALHSLTVTGEPYLVGPLARLNLNYEKLHPTAKAVLDELNLEMPITNPYKALIARAVELVEVYALAIDLVEGYAPEGPAHVALDLKVGKGCAATEAPRGLLYHHYEVDEKGFIKSAHIMPPTAQNLARIEEDLRQLVPLVIEKPHEEATLDCEHLIRSYDPCISCATHFLTLDIERK